LHKNLDKLSGLDVGMYIISGDNPEQQLELYKALEVNYGQSLPFVSDPELKMIELFKMKNGDVANRGYGILDEDGNVVFNTINDNWGEQLDKTVKEIKEELENMHKG
jgi:alkyl hydroperoxide reductase subunit AhpC